MESFGNAHEINAAGALQALASVETYLKWMQCAEETSRATDKQTSSPAAPMNAELATDEVRMDIQVCFL